MNVEDVRAAPSATAPIAAAERGSSPVWRRLSDWLVGSEGVQRVRATQSLIAFIVYLLFVGVQYFETAQGLIDFHSSILLSAFYLGGAAAFFLAIRSGLNRRFASDPSLTFSQCLFGIGVTCMAYAITGPARGAVMCIVLLILVFAMFALPPARIRILAGCAFALLLAAMIWRIGTSPDRYPPAVEATHLMFAMIIFTAISVLSMRMGALRNRLVRQRAELTEALEQNRRLATLDDLTGLANRRHMTQSLRAEHERQLRGGQAMSLVLVDIDHFKRVNDLFGHAAGDSVLRRFAEVATNEMRACDMLSRWGGEEFLVLMPDVDSQQALIAVDRLREALARLKWPETHADLQVTLSAGIATSSMGEPVDAVIERADRAMYVAKSTGRNRVCMAPGSLPSTAPGFGAPVATERVLLKLPAPLLGSPAE